MSRRRAAWLTGLGLITALVGAAPPRSLTGPGAR